MKANLTEDATPAVEKCPKSPLPMRPPIPIVPFLCLSLLAGGLLSGESPAWAQEQQAAPAAAPAPSIGAPAGQVVGTVAGNADQNPDQPAKTSTLAERNALARAQYEMRLRAMMTDFGIEEATSQDAVITYLSEDEAGKRAVRGAARRMMTAVRAGAAPEKMRESIAIYKAALDADKERRRAAQSALDAKIGFSLSPRLEATLWILGVLGEGQTGLPLAVLTPRTSRNGPGDGTRDGKHDANRDEKHDGTRRGGTIRGVVTRKAQGWIEVRADGGATDRYLPFWTGGEPPLETAPGTPVSREEWSRLYRSTLEALTAVKIGDRVGLDWVWSERKRVVRLEILPPQTAIPEPATNAPTAPVPTAPVPTAPVPTAPVPTPEQPNPEGGDAAPTHPGPANPNAAQQELLLPTFQP